MTLNFAGLFPPGREPTVNFDWTDIVAATGYIEFDGWSSSPTAGTTYKLTPSDIITNLIGLEPTEIGTLKSTQGTDSTANTITKNFDLDFDTTELQQPRSIRGEAVIKIGVLWHQAGVNSHDHYLIARVRKWDGATETEIASVQSKTRTTTAIEEEAYTLIIDIPKTNIKKGEQIRVTIEGWAKNTDGTTHHWFHLAHDPLNRANASPALTLGNTRVQAAIPFEINV